MELKPIVSYNITVSQSELNMITRAIAKAAGHQVLPISEEDQEKYRELNLRVLRQQEAHYTQTLEQVQSKVARVSGGEQ